jgi:hypothetical protein
MSRMFTAALSLGALVALAGGFAIAADAGKCTIATKGEENAVTKACAKGGIKEAKKTMKAMVKVAKDAGKKWECDTCHKDEETWKLTADGEKLFKEMLALQK